MRVMHVPRTHCTRHGVAFEDAEEFIARRAGAIATAHAIAIDADAGVILENFGCIFDRLIALQAGQSCGSVALASLRRLG